MIGIVCKRVSVNRTRLRKDPAPVTAAIGGSISGLIPFAPRLLSSTVIARLCRFSSFPSAFHEVRGTGQSCPDQVDACA